MSRYRRILLPGLNKAVFLGALLILSMAACRTKDPSWKFAHITDTQANTSQWGKAGADLRPVNVRICGEIAKAVAQEKVDLVIITGDLVDCGNDASYKLWRETMSPIYEAGIPVYPVRGNHDAHGGVNPWKNAFGAVIPSNGPAGEVGFTYFVTNKNAIFIGLDAYADTNRLERIDQAWLDNIVDKKTSQHMFVYAHEPAFKILQFDCLGAYPEDRNKLWETMKRGDARIYFHGHDHCFDHARIDDGDGNPDNDIHQFLTGPSGGILAHGGNYDGQNAPYTPKQIAHEEQYGYTVCEIKGPEAKVIWKLRVNSNVFEQAETWSYTVTNK